MRSLVVTLTSLQVQTAPSILDHWYITVDQTDSGSTTFTYPNSADGSLFTTTTGTYVYPVTADGGNIYPWGYPVANTVTTINLGMLKGPYTITFSPSGIDSRYYDISKIGYTFGDGTSQTVEKSIIQNSPGNSITGGLPTNINVSHAYYPSSTNTTFTPSVTVINSNLVLNIFNISFTLTPASIYDFNDVHLISNTQSSNNQLETVNVFEIESPNYVTNVRVISGT